MILVAWQFSDTPQRESLSHPVPCQLVFYEQKNDAIQMRLVADFGPAMALLDQRYRDTLPVQNGMNIIQLYILPESPGSGTGTSSGIH